jgi:hypothetical protein
VPRPIKEMANKTALVAATLTVNSAAARDPAEPEIRSAGRTRDHRPDLGWGQLHLLTVERMVSPV